MGPHCLYVCRGGRDKARGVWAVHPIESGVRFGPLEGNIIPLDECTEETNPWPFTNTWEIYCGGKLCHLRNLSDGSRTDWPRHVTSTYASWSEVNMAAYQCRGNVYYVTTRAVDQGGELVLGLSRTELEPPWIEREKTNDLNIDPTCVVCKRQHAETPSVARRCDWRSQVERADVEFDDRLPILKLSRAEVLEWQSGCGGERGLAANSRRGFRRRRFFCHLCGWRFRTFRRYTSHKVSHRLRYLKFRFQPRGPRSSPESQAKLGADDSSSRNGHSESDFAQEREETQETAVDSRREEVSTESPCGETDQTIHEQKEREHLSPSERRRARNFNNNHVSKTGAKETTGGVGKLQKPPQKTRGRPRRLPQRKRAGKPQTASHRRGKVRARDAEGAKRKRAPQTGKRARFACERCDKTFTSGSNLEKHVRVHTGEKPHACSRCDKRFADASNLRTHLRVHTGHRPYRCETCDKQFRYLQGFKQHVSRHGRTAPARHRCRFCSREFGQKGPCRTHEKSHQRDRPFECPVCKMKFKREGGLQMHADKMHPSSLPPGKQRGKARGGKRQQQPGAGVRDDHRHHCQVCGKGFKFNYSLKQHTRIHTGEKPFKCGECDAAFSQSSNLTSHRRVHTGEAPYKCRHCEKAFACPQNLRSHLRVHTGERPYQCPHAQCGARFAYSSYLKTHSLVHSDRKPLKCAVCPKEYRHPASFKLHCQTHVDKQNADGGS